MDGGQDIHDDLIHHRKVSHHHHPVHGSLRGFPFLLTHPHAMAAAKLHKSKKHNRNAAFTKAKLERTTKKKKRTLISCEMIKRTS